MLIGDEEVWEDCVHIQLVNGCNNNSSEHDLIQNDRQIREDRTS